MKLNADSPSLKLPGLLAVILVITIVLNLFNIQASLNENIMLQAARSAALASADRLKTIATQGGDPLSQDSVREAILVAVKVAKQHGADPSGIRVVITTKPITMADGLNVKRQVVDVWLNKINEGSWLNYFNFSDVKPVVHAAATWGYQDEAALVARISEMLHDKLCSTEARPFRHKIGIKALKRSIGQIDLSRAWTQLILKRQNIYPIYSLIKQI